MIKENRLRLLVAMVLMLLVGASTGACAYLVKPILDDVFFNKDEFMLAVIPFAIMVVFLVRGAAEFGNSYLMGYVGQIVIKKLRDELYASITGLPLSFFHQEKTGRLMSRVTNDVAVLKSMVSNSVTGILRDGFTVIALVFVVIYRDWQLAIYALLILPLGFYPIFVISKRVRRISTGCQECIAQLNSYLHETFAGVKIVKAFGMEQYEKDRFYAKTKDLFDQEMSQAVAKNLPSPVMECLAGAGIAFIVWYGGYRVIDGVSTAGTFFSFMTAVMMLYDPVKKLSKVNSSVQEGLAATDRIFDIVERESDIVERQDPVHIRRGPHSVEFDRVWFGYDDNMVLKDIRIHAKAGEIIALAGMSGGGKTSLVNLIPRFYDVSEGRVLIDGLDIRDASLSSLRDQIAIVTQEPILFNDTVRNNIAFGNIAADDEQIELAAKAAYAYDFVREFPRGFDTSIGELGSRLSGGEKQRICIARALLKDAPVLILDEATSALDAESERLVQKALENLMQGRTTFVIAHRLSTIANADRILVLVDGRIVEEGSRSELMERRGEFFKLTRMQLKN